MKRILVFILPIVLMTACVESLEDWNVDQKKASAVPARTLFSNALKSVTDILTTPNVNSNNFRMFVQYWATTTYLDEPRYEMTARLYSQNIWYALYRDALNDLKEAKRLVNEDELLAADLKTNQLALIEIAEVFCWNVLINTFGDVPYTESLDTETLLPKYDDAATIHADLLSRLDAAMATIIPTAGSFGTADLLYKGDVAGWTRFGNSLKLKLGMMLADVDVAKARTTVEQAVAGGAGKLILMNSQNARFPYISSPPSNNPISANLNPIYSSREDFVMASTIIDAMKARNDPRMAALFTKVDGEYVGGKYGFANAYAKYSHVGSKLIESSFEALLTDASEIHFLLAEAVERGFTVPTMSINDGSAVALSTAEDFYNYGIKQSILYWGGTEADATTYLAQPNVAYTTAAGEWAEKIGTQKWIALNNRGWDAWVEWRRLDFPKLLPPSGEGVVGELKIPVRMIYPVIEQTVNTDQWTIASGRYAAEIPDSPNAKLFWDKK